MCLINLDKRQQAALDLQTRGSQRQSKGYNTSEEDNGGHGAGCIFLVGVNHVPHNAKYFQNSTAPENGCANVPAIESQHMSLFTFLSRIVKSLVMFTCKNP